MTHVVRCSCILSVLFIIQSCAKSSQLPAETESQSQPLRRRGDLALEIPDPAAAVTFGHLTIAEDSCEIYEGCAGGPGRRAVMEIRVNVRNVGQAPIDLGAPWESPYFNPSLCQQTNTMYGFITAELRDANMQVVATGALSSNCLADREGGFTCMAQGLGAGSVVSQPEGQCDYLDITEVPAGDYTLRLTVNPDGEIPESDSGNNSLEFVIHYPACDGELCGGVCCPQGVACHDGVCLLPDLRVNAESAAESLWLSHETFGENSCELAEQCVSGSGERRLLNFEGRIENWGPGDLSPGPEHDNPLFEYSACHEHYHFKDFTEYRLLDTNGNVVAQGHKQSFCLVDMEPVDTPSMPSPPGTRPTPQPTGGLIRVEGPGEPQGCNYLSAGWADIYGVGTPCQWVDVTDVPAGDYVLSLSVNPLGRVAETSLDNNTVLIPVLIPEDVPCEPQPEICGDAIDQDCDEQPDAWDEDCWQGGCEPGNPFCETPTQVTGNDTCEDAYELTEAGTFAGVLNQITPPRPAACGGNGSSAFFQFVLDREQVVYVGAIGSSIDTVISLYQGGCSVEPMRCADDDCSTRSGHFAALLPAGSYIAAVSAKRSDEAGAYRFKFERADAGGARIIDRPGVYAGDTTSAGDDAQACEGYGPAGFGSGPDDVYVVATCNAPVTVSTCGSTTFYSLLEARVPTPSEFEPSLQCGDSFGCQADPMGATLTAYSMSSGLMFITVDGERADDAGEYQLSVSY